MLRPNSTYLVIIGAVLALLLATVSFAQQKSYPGLIGVGISDGSEGARNRMFVDLGKVFRPDGVPLGADGIAGDAQVLFFDIRPVPAWSPPIDDPASYQPDWSGTYHLSFTGQADVTSAGDPVTINNKAYDASSNTTTAEVAVPSGTGLLVLRFSNTKRTPTSATASGFTNLRLIRPGYAANTAQVFTSQFLSALHPFSTLRFMGFSATNDNAFPYPAQMHWSDRHTPADATQQVVGTRHGFAWEYAIQICNLAHKDIWINIPVAASDDYILQLAQLLKSQLNPDLKIYVEHSNEVWNSLFPQYEYNKSAAIADVGKGGSKLNSDGTSDQDTWARRRHAQRLIQAIGIFRTVFGAEAINTRVRGVYAHWTIFPSQYASVLTWVKNTYGDPGSFFYAIAQTHYFNDEAARRAGVSVDGVLQAMSANSDGGRGYTTNLKSVADAWELKLFSYEGGPDNGGGDTTNIGNRILANRAPGMQDLMIHDLADNWFPLGGGLHMYLELSSAYSRWGCWGMNEEVADLTNYKWQAVYALAGDPRNPAASRPALQSVVPSAGHQANPIVPGSYISLAGSDMASAAVVAAPPLPLSLGGLRVLSADRESPVVYAAGTQANAIIPAGLPTDSEVPVMVERDGWFSQAITIQTTGVQPYIFVLDTSLFGGDQAAARIANSTVIVSSKQIPGVWTRAAHAGDTIEIYASGLGPTDPFVNAGEQPPIPPPAVKNTVHVSIGGKIVPASWAGLSACCASLYVVSVQMPDGVAPGDAVPVVLVQAGVNSNTATIAVE